MDTRKPNANDFSASGVIETHPLAPRDREQYVEHTADDVTGEFAGELEALLLTHPDSGPLDANETALGWWIARVDCLAPCVTALVGMPRNGLLSRLMPGLAGVQTWTNATWHGVSGLIVRLVWRSQWLVPGYGGEGLHDPISVTRPDGDLSLWVPRADDARLTAALGLGE